MTIKVTIKVMIKVTIMVTIMVMIKVKIMVIMVHLLERLGRGATMAPGNSLSVTAVNKSSSIVTAKANSLWILLLLLWYNPLIAALLPQIFSN